MTLERPQGERLIKTKYSRPQANEHIISRKHLQNKLDKSLKRKLTLVAAPSGYGKTTAVLEWLDKTGAEAAWLSIDSNDNNPLRFWQYLCASLDRIAPGLAAETEYVFSLPELVNANIQISIILDRMAIIEYDFVVIVDDVHLITNLSILQGLSYLIDYLPPRMHLLFISRTVPEIKAAKHSIKSQMQILGINDLRFREEEIIRFYEMRGFLLNKQDIKQVENYTNGWTAALVAIAMSMKEAAESSETAENLAFSNIEQYLVDEVISIWPREKRMFVLKTSILDTLCEGSCSAVMGDKNAARLLVEISEKNEFIITLDQEKSLYRYHHIFKDSMYNLLCKSEPDSLTDLHARAADWYLEQGQLSQAMEHYLKGSRYDEAYRMLEGGRMLGRLVNQHDYDTGFSWINRLPAAYREKSMKIACFYSFYHADMNQLETAWEWFSKARGLARSKGEHDRSISDKLVLSLLNIYLLILEGRVEELYSTLLNFEENELIMEHFNFNQADIYFYRCQVHLMARLFGENFHLFSDVVGTVSRVRARDPGYMTLAAGEYCYENNLLEEALPYLLDAYNKAGTVNCPGSLVPTMVNLARVKRAQGDTLGAFEILDQCEHRLSGINQIHWNYLIQAYKSRLYIEMGKMDMSDEWINSRKLNPYVDINRVNEFELIVFARALMTGDRNADSEILLLRLLAFSEAEGRKHSQVEILNLLSILAYKGNNLTGAVGYLEKSLSIGMEEGYIRSYVDELESITCVLKHAVGVFRKRGEAHKGVTTYAKKLLGLVRDNMHVLSAASSRADIVRRRTLLTAKETEVLELLLAACSNEEICSRLNITLRTVKAHTGNIYSKLGVKNRSQCVKLVRETGLLE